MLNSNNRDTKKFAKHLFLVDGLSKIFIKSLRVFGGIVKYIDVKIHHKFKPIDFEIFKLNIISPELCFNLSVSHMNASKRYIGAARRYVESDNIYHEADVYIGSFGALNKLVQLGEIDMSLLQQKIHGFVRLEDLRVFTHNDNVFALCVCICKSYTDSKMTSLNAKQLLIKIIDQKICAFKILDTGVTIEKNWTLLNIENDSARLLYSLNPFQEINVHLSLNDDVEYLNVEPISSLKYRNSTNFCQIEDFQLGLGHSTIDLGFRYAYLHFFIKICADGQVLMSKPFVFNEFSNEFAMSLVSEKDERFVVLFSNHNKGNYAATFSASNLKESGWRNMAGTL